MRHEHRQICVLHDVAGRAAEDHLPQPVPCEGALDQEVAIACPRRAEHRFACAAAFQLDADRLGSNIVVLELPEYLVEIPEESP